MNTLGNEGYIENHKDCFCFVFPFAAVANVTTWHTKKHDVGSSFECVTQVDRKVLWLSFQIIGQQHEPVSTLSICCVDVLDQKKPVPLFSTTLTRDQSLPNSLQHPQQTCPCDVGTTIETTVATS